MTKLLKEGISWEAIQNMTTQEITLALATLTAYNDLVREADLRASAYT